MDFKEYNKLCFYSYTEDFKKASFNRLTSYHWESVPPYRPKTFFKMGVVGEDLVAVLKCYESNPRAVFTKRDDPVYRDSCLEFFVSPIAEREEYINIETNSKGIFLCEFGEGRENRILVSTLTENSPCVKAFSGEDAEGLFWGVEIKLTKDFLAELYNTDKNSIDFTMVRANFYKCGDDCDIPHYLAFSPVTTLPPGFHNPQCFSIFKK